MNLRLEVRNENLPLKAPFRISGYTQLAKCLLPQGRKG
jgi:hypothetical protein